MTWDTLLTRMLELAEPAISALMLLVLGLVARWLIRHTEHIRQEEARRAAQHLIGNARDTLYQAMRETYQTYVAERKAASADGKLTPDEAEEARRRALEAFQKRLGEGGQKVLEQLVGDVAGWAQRELEALMVPLKAEVGELPKSPASGSAPSGSASPPAA